MHSMCIRKMMFVFELFIITDRTTFILALKAVLRIKLLLIKLRKLKVIVDNYLWNASLMSGWRSLKLLLVTKGRFDT